MRLDNFDLNLLVALDALLEARSVTLAAKRLNVTQAAMSAALKRLREALRDELLVQQGKKMFPTQHALALAPEVSAALVRLRSLISTGTAFDPRTSERTFTIISSDYITVVLLVPLISELHEDAPGVRLDLILPAANSPERLENGEADLMISPPEFMRGEHPKEVIFEERLVVVGCQSNTILRKGFTKKAFLECGHVAVKIEGRDTFIENALRAEVPDRRIDVTAQSFIQVPWLLRNTDLVAVMHERLANVCAPSLSLRIVDPPFSLPRMQEMMQYHATRSQDPGLKWLRSRLLHVARKATVAAGRRRTTRAAQART